MGESHKLKIDFLVSSGGSTNDTFFPFSKDAIPSLVVVKTYIEDTATYNTPSSNSTSVKKAPPPRSIPKKLERVIRNHDEITRMQKVIDSQPYYTKEDCLNWWISSLRAQTYCIVLSSPSKETEDNKFRCTFSNSCQKLIKGKGNLRRHIEWHLRRIEEECRNSNLFQAIAESDCKDEIKQILKDKLKSKFVDTVSEFPHSLKDASTLAPKQ